MRAPWRPKWNSSTALVAAQERKLGNEQFVARAPAAGRGQGTRKAGRLAGAGRLAAGEAAGARMREPEAPGARRRIHRCLRANGAAARRPAPHHSPATDRDPSADSVCTLPDFRGAAEFLFDEVVSEGEPAQFRPRHRRSREAGTAVTRHDGAGRAMAPQPHHRATAARLATQHGLPDRTRARRGRPPQQSVEDPGPDHLRHRRPRARRAFFPDARWTGARRPG